MKRPFKSILATMLVAATLTATAPVTAIPAAAATTTSTTTTAATTKTTTMYVTKSCYSYKTASVKGTKVNTLYKGAAIKVTGEKGSFYVLADGSYVKKTNVGSKRINWTDTKYKTTLTRYASKDNVKVRSGALSTSKVVKTLKKGTKLTIVAKTNSGYYKLSDGNYVLASSVTKTKPTTTTSTTNTAFPEDPYGPGENGYPSLGQFQTGDGDGYGYCFIDCVDDTEYGYLEIRQEPFCFTEKKLTAVGGKDIPYGWYCIVGENANGNFARKDFPNECMPTLDIYGTDGKLKTYGIYTKGEIFYLGKGEKLVARNMNIAPAKGGTITYRGVPFEDYIYDTDLQQSSLVTKKGTGYGIEAGTYKVTIDPDTERINSWGQGAWVYVVHDYANIQTVNVRKTENNHILNTRDLATTGEFLYSDLSLSPNHFKEQTFVWRFNKNGIEFDTGAEFIKKIQPKTDLTPRTITLKAGDLVICRGCTVSKIS